MFNKELGAKCMEPREYWSEILGFFQDIYKADKTGREETMETLTKQAEQAELLLMVFEGHLLAGLPDGYVMFKREDGQVIYYKTK